MCGLNALVRRHCANQAPRHVSRVTRDVQIATLALMADSSISPDTTIPSRFAHGFQLEGDIEDSGVHRAVEPRDRQAYLQERSSIQAGAWSALHRLEERVNSRGASDPLDVRQELTRVTEEQTTLGRMSQPMTHTELYREIFGTSQPTRISQADKLTCPLISLRFGAPQKGKIRPIEDCAASGVNKSLFMRETIAPITFD
jgi:hypothetical protein